MTIPHDLVVWLAAWGACDLAYTLGRAVHKLGRKFGRWLREGDLPS